MRLQDLTKAELIAIICKLEENSICERYVQSVLIDAQRKSEYAAIEESEKASTEYLLILNEYNKLLKPYMKTYIKGEIKEVPLETVNKAIDILTRLDAARKRMHDAAARYNKLAGI